ncbi:MAG: ATP-dependent Clp protease ATP-binding subunit ClpX, partial [Planctomycetes bacterium]|nr:ATP-dependent Clp protease ATP-binding subunit ClpX [Planctomycetota bacterium]
LIPEFTGRLPVITTLDTLDCDALVRVLQEPKNALVRQFQAIFELNGKSLEFTQGALVAIAQTAIDRETGVRALRSILEDLLLDLLYELPARKDQDAFVVDEDVVSGHKQLARGLTADSPMDPDVDDDDEPAAEEERESA